MHTQKKEMKLLYLNNFICFYSHIVWMKFTEQLCQIIFAESIQSVKRKYYFKTIVSGNLCLLKWAFSRWQEKFWHKGEIKFFIVETFASISSFLKNKTNILHKFNLIFSQRSRKFCISGQINAKLIQNGWLIDSFNLNRCKQF